MFGGELTTCSATVPVLAGYGLTCDSDVAATVPQLSALPSGTKLSSFCGKQCSTQCKAAKAACILGTSGPSGTPTTTELAAYVTCLGTECADADDALVSAMFGG